MRFLQGWAGDVKEGQTGKPKGKKKEGVSGWSKELCERLPQEMASVGVRAVEITGSGEPLSSPHIGLLFDKIAEAGLEMALVTNAQQLTREMRGRIHNLQWARFSMDSFTPITHSLVHGVKLGTFNRCLDHILGAVQDFPDAYLGVSFIVTSQNFREIYDATVFWKSHGLRSIRFSFEYEPTGTAKLSSEEINEARHQINEAKKLSDTSFRVFGQVDRLVTYDMPNTDFHYCGHQMMTCNIGYDAKIYPCCIEIYKSHQVIGNLYEKSFKDIMFGEERRKYVESFDVRGCNPCWIRDKCIALETLLAPERRIGHANFP